MNLSRRDALAALAAAGVTAGTGAWVASTGVRDRGGGSEEDDASASLSGSDAATIVAVARAVYPDEVSGIEEFVETYSDGRIERAQDDDYRRGVIDAIEVLDDRSRAWYDGPFLDLDAETRDSLLREIGADTADANPDGSDAERVRHYLVNEVLFALYASPTGGKLVGIENPRGHPGGLESYRRGPGE